MFTPSRLTLARKRRGLTKTRLAALSELSVRSLTSFESGEAIPADETLSRLSDVLKFPPDFFSAQEIDEPSADAASFRALSSMTAGQRDAALSAGALAMELCGWIEKRFVIPEPDVPRLGDDNPEAAAEAVRAQWQLGSGVVGNMIHLLESKGVRVFSLAEECRQVDAFSLWSSDAPYVFLNTKKSAERSRFDAAHELGHLVLHGQGSPNGRAAEIEADRFASAFLMPRASVLGVAPRLPSLDALIKLKRRWKVSVAALTYRLRSLDLLSEWHYRSLCIEIARRGYRSKEPEEGPRETSQLLAKILTALREEGVGKLEIASALHQSPPDLDALVFGLAMVSLQGVGRGNGKSSSKLRLV